MCMREKNKIKKTTALENDLKSEDGTESDKAILFSCLSTLSITKYFVSKQNEK